MMHAYAPLLFVSPLLLAIVAIDHRTKRIPDVLSLGALAVTAVAVTVLAVSSHEAGDARSALLGALFLTGILGALHLLRPDGLGMGDVKLALTLGLLVGWAQPDALAVALMVAWTLMAASTIGLVTVALAVRRQQQHPVRTLAVPFGPSLCLGTTMVVLFGPSILASQG